MGIFRHLFSLVSSLWVILNLGFWMFPLLAFALIRFLFGWIPPIKRSCNYLIDQIYHIAAWLNSFWMLYVVRINVDVKGTIPDHPSPIVVVNHQSWMDIPVVHHVVTGQGPILKFLIKKNLVWVPIVGWLCWALGMPRLDRSGSREARQKDLAAIRSATTSLTNESGALLIYAEGTRFTPEKHSDQNSPYKNLLTPRPGGLKIALDSVDDDTPVLDLTIIYEGGDTHFWRCLGGATKHIRVYIEEHRAGDITDARDWLTQRWLAKDALF